MLVCDVTWLRHCVVVAWQCYLVLPPHMQRAVIRLVGIPSDPASPPSHSSTPHSDGVYVVTGPLYLPSPEADPASGRPGWRMSYPMIGGRPKYPNELLAMCVAA